MRTISPSNTNANTAVKTAESPLNGARIPLGAHAGNTGGKRGRSGRRPDWIREFCEGLLASPKCKAAVRAILSDANHPAFVAMWKACAERAYGRPTQHETHAGALAIHVVREPRPGHLTPDERRAAVIRILSNDSNGTTPDWVPGAS